MVGNHLLLSLRQARRHKAYTFINVAGLAVGIACCLLILLFVRDELSYDRFHQKADRIYRVTVGEEQIVTPTIVAPLFKREFPEVEQVVRLYDVGSFSPVVVRHGDQTFREEQFFYADSSVFSIFTLPLLAGRPETALTRPGTVVISRSAAARYFAASDPLGQTLIIGPEREFEVTAVMEDMPSNSHLQFDFLASFATLGWSQEETWGSANFLTYVVLRDEQALSSLQGKIPDLLDRVRRQQAGVLSSDYELALQPLTGIRLYAEGRITYVYLFSAIAVFILLIACINYLNLATARSVRRAREVGVRKALGAHRWQLARQFYVESFALTAAAVVLALPLTWLLLPLFGDLSGKNLTLDLIDEPGIVAALAGLGLIVGLLAGSYPALLLSSFQPVRVLKPSLSPRTGGSAFRKGLVAFQFAVSVFLIVATSVVYLQLDYMRSTNLGFDREQVIVLPLPDQQLRRDYGAIKDAILQHPGIQYASAVNSVPGYQRGGYALIAEGLELPEGEYFPIRGVPADRDVVETLGLILVAGPGFPRSESYVPENGRYAYLFNEATVRALGWSPEEAIGRSVGVSGGRMGEVAGVVADYHYAPLYEGIEPLALFIEEPEAYEHLLVKTASTDLTGTLQFLRGVWAERAPNRPFEFSFLDQRIDALYRADEQTGRLFTAFAVMAVLIACLGLYGLAAFSAEQRTKEISVRKVLGASVGGIIYLLSREFARLVLIGLVLAVPAAYVGMDRWLDHFAYRIEIGPVIFLAAGGLVLLIALLTVSYQAFKAALADPVKSLRYE